MKKKIVSLLLASMMAITGLVGCGNSNTAATSGQDTAKASGGEDVHITYALWDSNQAKGIRKMADEFESKNKGIKIDLQVVAGVIIGQCLKQRQQGDHFQILSGCIQMKFIDMLLIICLWI